MNVVWLGFFFFATMDIVPLLELQWRYPALCCLVAEIAVILVLVLFRMKKVKTKWNIKN